MALTPAQIQEILNGINPADMDGFASNPNSVIDKMTDAEFKQGLECGNLSLEDLNYLFLYGFLSTQKSLEVSKDYTDSQITARANLCNALSPRSGNLLQIDEFPDGCKFYYGIEAAADTANLYFDPVSGNNSNAGTKASPLKTMDEGFRRNNTGTAWTAWLAEGKTHEMRSSWGNFAGQSVAMRPYGSNYDSVVVNNPPSTSYWARCAEITGARVKWISDKQASNGAEDARCINSTGNTPTSTISSAAITHDTTDVADHPLSSNYFSFINGLSIKLSIIGGGFVTGNSFFFANANNSNLSAVLSNVLVDSSNGNRLIMLENTVNSIIVEQQGGAPGTVIPNSNGALTWRNSSTKAEVLALVDGQTGIIAGNLITN